MQDLTFFRGHEAWVGEFLSMLPADRSFLRNYVENVAQVTHANAGYHVGMGLILLSQLAPLKGIRATPTSKPKSNLFVLVLGPTGEAKTACITLGEQIGKMGGLQTLVSNVPGSREGLQDSLDDQDPALNGNPRQALLYPEFADFLSITKAGGHGRSAGHAATMRAAFMGIFDGGSAIRVLAGSRDRTSGQVNETKRGTENPVVSMIGAANYHVLTQHTDEDDWHSGFMGRYLMIDGEMERFHPQMRPWPASMERVVEVITNRLQWEKNRITSPNPFFPPPAQGLPYGMYHDDASDLMDSWATRIHMEGRGERDGLVAAARPRLQPLCDRIAALLCFDFGEAAGHGSGGIPPPGWRISKREVEAAIYLTERHLAAYRVAATHVVLNYEERPIRAVEVALRKADATGESLTEGQISLSARLNDRSVSDALRTLMSRGVVRKTQPVEGTTALRYQIVDGFSDKVRLFPGTTMASVLDVATPRFQLR